MGAYYGVRRTDSDGGGGNGTGGAPVHLVASNAYDPQGDGQEHDEEVPNATDGDPATYWETEDYRQRRTSAISRTASGSSSTRAGP